MFLLAGQDPGVRGIRLGLGLCLRWCLRTPAMVVAMVTAIAIVIAHFARRPIDRVSG